MNFRKYFIKKYWEKVFRDEIKLRVLGATDGTTEESMEERERRENVELILRRNEAIDEMMESRERRRLLEEAIERQHKRMLSSGSPLEYFSGGDVAYYQASTAASSSVSDQRDFFYTLYGSQEPYRRTSIHYTPDVSELSGITNQIDRWTKMRDGYLMPRRIPVEKYPRDKDLFNSVAGRVFNVGLNIPFEKIPSLFHCFTIRYEDYFDKNRMAFSYENNAIVEVWILNDSWYMRFIGRGGTPNTDELFAIESIGEWIKRKGNTFYIVRPDLEFYVQINRIPVAYRNHSVWFRLGGIERTLIREVIL